VAAKVKGLEHQRGTGAVTSSGRVTVGAYLAEWIARKERMSSVRPLTLSGYRTDERHMAAAIGRVRLDRLVPANVEHLWSSMLDRGLSVAHCRRTLNAAVKRGVMARNPVRVAETPHQREAEIEPYTIEEMGSLLRAARGSRNSTRWTMAMALGLRQGEVLGLCWDDVVLPAGEGSEATVTVRRQLQRLSWQHGCSDPERCVNRAGTHAKRAADCPQRWGGGLRVSEPKSAAGRRTLTLPATLAAELRVHQAAQKVERLASEVWEPGSCSGWVFANPVGGPTDPRADARYFKALCAKAGVPPKRLHDLRRLAATMMLASDLDLRTPGHSQLALTARYSHVFADRRSVAAAPIDQALFGAKRRDS
jgi:integrase